MMVARLLNLEDAERQREYELDEDLKNARGHLSSTFSSGAKETNVEAEPVGMSGWDPYGNDEIQSQNRGSAYLATTHPIPQPELIAIAKRGKNDTVLPASKWAGDDDDSDDEKKKSARGLGLSYSSSGSENVGDGLGKAEDETEVATDTSVSMQQDSGMNEEQRQKMRRLEVALIEYRESLEERGDKSAEEIERKVAVHRKRLQSEYGLSDSPQDVTVNSNRTNLPSMAYLIPAKMAYTAA